MTTPNMYDLLTDYLVRAEMAGHEDRLAFGCMGFILVSLVIVAGFMYLIL